MFSTANQVISYTMLSARHTLHDPMPFPARHYHCAHTHYSPPPSQPSSIYANPPPLLQSSALNPSRLPSLPSLPLSLGKASRSAPASGNVTGWQTRFGETSRLRCCGGGATFSRATGTGASTTKMSVSRLDLIFALDLAPDLSTVRRGEYMGLLRAYG